MRITESIKRDADGIIWRTLSRDGRVISVSRAGQEITEEYMRVLRRTAAQAKRDGLTHREAIEEYIAGEEYTSLSRDCQELLTRAIRRG